ncbi:hypothetical protein GCM10022215_40450 [Nocardioides fonticola]|uniref:Uncharacterized protein n=1 Tax=Nocardioides fonticola TaxID=450363 RepID=A0ABP7XZY7_9ACTN
MTTRSPRGRRNLAATVGLSTLALYGLVGVPLAAPASAAALPVPAGATAAASGQVLHVKALNVPAAGVAAADVILGRADGALKPTAPRVTASAKNLDGTALTAIPLDLLSSAEQQAAPDNPKATQASLIAGSVPLTIPGVLDLGVSNVSAHARFRDDQTCLTTVPLSTSEVSTADVSVLSTLDLGPGLIDLPGTASVKQGTSFAPNGSPNGGATVVSAVTGSTASLRLAGNKLLEVTSKPLLVAEADGTKAGTKVTYTTPIVTLGGQTVVPGDPVSLPGALGQLIELSIGTPTITRAADGLGVSASVSAIHLKVTLAGVVDIAEVDLFPMTATAAAPAGGVQCGTVSGPNDDDDKDGLTNGQEAIVGTDPTNPDTDGDGTGDAAEDLDGDGLTNLQEFSGSLNTGYGNQPTDPTKADTDNDGLSDSQEIKLTGTDPNKADTDGDGTGDAQEDPDVDGLTNLQEVTGSANSGFGNAPTNPLDADSDDGGVGDGAEITAGTDPNKGSDDKAAASPDTDGDGLTDAEEAVLGTDPTKADTDGDKLGDGQEVKTTKTDPLNPDTDGDGLKDGPELITYGSNPLKTDTDGDKLKDGAEVKTYGTDPADADTDNEGLKDGAEVKTYGTNPTRADTDGDGLDDKVELTGSANTRYNRCPTNPNRFDTDRDGLGDGIEIRKYRTNPCDRDTDDGGVSDGREVKAGSDPLDPKSGPNHPRTAAARRG